MKVKHIEKEGLLHPSHVDSQLSICARTVPVFFTCTLLARIYIAIFVTTYVTG